MLRTNSNFLANFPTHSHSPTLFTLSREKIEERLRSATIKSAKNCRRSHNHNHIQI